MKRIFQPWVLTVLVAAATVVAFWPCLHAQFVDLDDTNLIVHNAHFLGFSWEHVRWMFAGSFAIGVYIPLTWMSLALDYRLWGMQPFGFHLTNVLLHAANAVLCFYLMDRLFELARQKDEPESVPLRRGAAAFAALFFAIHPLRVESAAWIVERRDVLSGLFFFLTLLFYLAYAQSKTVSEQRRWLAASLGVYLLLLLSKAIGMTMPLLFILLDFYPLGRLGGQKPVWGTKEARGVWLEKWPFLLLGLVFAALAAHAQKASGAMWILHDLGLSERVALLFHSLFFYLWKTFWPSHLYAIHELPSVFHWGDPVYLGSAVAVILVSAVALWQRRERPALFYVWLSYAGILLPVSGLFQSGPLTVADHASYLSCLGWAALFGSALENEWPRSRLVVGSGALILLVVLGVLTWEQCALWQNAETLYRHVIQEAPESFIARNQWGNMLVSEGKVKEGIEQLQEALKIKSAVAVAYNLAFALEKDGRLQDAAREYSLVIRSDPANVRAYNNLGLLYLKVGLTEGAIACFREGLRHEDWPQLRYNLGLALAAQERRTSLKSSGSSARKDSRRP